MQAYVAVGWKVDDKTKRVIPFGIYCGPDGNAAERESAKARGDTSVNLVGLTIQIVYRSTRPMAVAPNPKSESHAQQLARGEKIAAEARAAREAEDAERLKVLHPKLKEVVAEAERPIEPDHAKRRAGEVAAAKAARIAEKEAAALLAKQQAEEAAEEARRKTEQEKLQAAQLDAVQPQPGAEAASHGERLKAQ